MRCAEKASIASVIAALLVMTAHAAAEAPAVPEGARVWMERFDYQVTIADAASEQARLFSARGVPSVLIMMPEFDDLLVLRLDGREVMLADRSSVIPGPDPEQFALEDAAIHGPAEPYTMNGETVVLYHEGRRIQIGRKPPLIGETSAEKILEHSPIYRKGMDQYTPSGEDIAYLKDYPLPVIIEVVFGSWCPACKQTVPRFMKSMSAAGNPNLGVSYTGVPTPPFSEYPAVKEKDIRGVPTFIVYAGQAEIGRISSIPGNSSVEHELVAILTAHRQSKR